MDTLITNPYYIIDYSMLIFWDAQRLVREYVSLKAWDYRGKTTFAVISGRQNKTPMTPKAYSSFINSAKSSLNVFSKMMGSAMPA